MYRMLNAPTRFSAPSGAFCMKLPRSNPVPHIDNERFFLATSEVDGRRYDADCRITWDGIEYVGRVWFTGESPEDGRLPDRGALPGRTREDVIALAEQLTPEELRTRFSRALAEKR